MDVAYYKFLLKQFGNATTPQAMAALDMAKVREAALWAVQTINQLQPQVSMNQPSQPNPKGNA